MTLPLLAAGLLAGELAGLFTPLYRVHGFAAAAALLALVFLVSARWRILAAPLAGAALGCSAVQAVLGDRLAPGLADSEVHVAGSVVSLPRQAPGRLSFLFRPDGGVPGLPSLLRVSWYRPALRPRAGERWRLVLRLRPARGRANPAGFDYERWLFRQRIGATALARGGQLLAEGGTGGNAADRLLALRAGLYQRLAGQLPDGIGRALVLALAIGERQELTAEHRQVLADSGTAHLVAISGLHVGLVAGVVFAAAAWLTGWVGEPARRPAQVLCWAVALAAAAAYAALAGLGLPTRRALIMLGVLALWRLARWPPRPLAPLSMALVLVLLSDPLAPLGWDFWLSFGAVACIGLAAAGSGARLPGAHARWWRIQLGICLGLAPCMAFAFGQLSVIAPLVNMLLVPWFGIAVLPPLLAALVLDPWFPALAGGLLEVQAWQLQWIWRGLEAAARVGAMPLAEPSWWALTMGFFGSALLLLPAGVPGKWLGALCWLPLVFPLRVPLSNGEVSLTVLDVGQGLATVVRTRRHVMVYDSGPAYPGGNAGRDVLLPYLRSLGLSRLDMLVTSHADLDHAGGRDSLAAVMNPYTELSGEPRNGALPCRAGQRWHWDGVTFEVLMPLPGGPREGNHASCVLHIRGPHGSALLPGDLEAGGERELARLWPCLGVDAVLAPHHGSKSSSTAALVEATRPRWVIYAAGYGNRWGFPARSVAERWADAGAAGLVTGESGAIVLEFSAKRAALPRLQRQVDTAAWRAPAVSTVPDVQYHARYSSRGTDTRSCSKSSDLADG